MIKVLHLRSSGGFLGAEKVVIELGNNLSNFGIESIIGIPMDRNCVPELADQAQKNNIRYELFNFSNPLSPAGVCAIRDFVRRENIDLVHSHGYREDIYAFIGLDCRRVVATNHLWKRTTNRLKLYAKADAFVMKFFPAVVAVSEPIFQEMRQQGFSAPQLHLVQNGISLCDYSVKKECKSKVREELGFGASDFVFGMVGSLSLEKGHQHAIRALASVLQRGLSAKLLIVGDGMESENLKKLVEDLSIGESVTFVGRRRDIPRVLHSLSAFLMPSLVEGLPMALLEAMATGLPVVATAVGDIPKLVEQDIGVLVSPEDADELSIAMEVMMKREAEFPEIGNKARELVEEKFSATHMAFEYAQIYREVLSQAVDV